MDISLFKNYLNTSGASEATTKNYLADVKRFSRYFEDNYALVFDPLLVTSKMIKDYQGKLVKDIGQRSVERHLSSLRRFFQFCSQEGRIKSNPFSLGNLPEVNTLDSLANLKGFKDHLYREKASDLTIKNYIIDVHQFLNWLSLAPASENNATELSATDIIRRLSPHALKSYKDRLIHQSDLSVSSINRKLSSLRSYLRWASLNGIIAPSLSANSIEVDQFATIPNVKSVDPLGELYALSEPEEQSNVPAVAEISSAYSSFPPVRLLQKSMLGLTLTLDFLLITPLAYGLSSCQFLFWKISGQRLFEPSAAKISAGVSKTIDPISQISNIKKGYFRTGLSPMENAIHKKFTYYLVNVRPLWYRKYQSYRLIRSIHTGLMMTMIAVAVMLVYNGTLAQDKGAILGQRVQSSGRTLSFKGVLADEKGKPITKPSTLGFSIYTSRTGAQNKLWQETREITPDSLGGFIVALGEEEEIPDYVFTQGKRLYVGVSVNNQGELIPRQPVPNVALAEDSQMLQGLLPITHPSAGSENVILALDSSGNLTLGGEKSHIFQTTGGSFQIKGQSVILSTITGSNGSIVLNPDGQGIIDLQKPLQNTSEDIIGAGPAGAVLINDSLAVNSNGTGEPALYISQNGLGPLISASSSGVTRFIVDNIGSTTIGHNLTIGGTDIASTRSVFNLLNRNVTIVNFAGESEAVTIGSASGTTTIRNARTSISGDLTISGPTGATFFAENSGINFSGGGKHTLMAGSGNLSLGTNLSIGENVNIIPETQSGTNNIGSESNPFDNIYASSFILPAKAILTPSGSLGLGTTNPSYKLHVTESKTNDAVAMLENTSTDLEADVLKLKLGTLTPSSTNKYINFLDGANNSLGSIQASSSGGVSYLTTGSDFAEYFRKEKPSELMVTGDLVCLGESGGVTLCDTHYNKIVGVITDRAGFVGASDKADNVDYTLVGLHGQVKVRIKATERILPGDSLGVSNVRGIAKRADSSGQILGRALESSGNSTSVLAYILPTWHDPSISLSGSGNLTIIPLETDDDDTKSYLVVDTISNKAVGSFGVFSEAVAGTLKSGLIQTKELITENMFANAVEADSIHADRVIAPVIESEKIKVTILSPVSDDALTIHLQNKRVEFIASQSPYKPVAVLDDKGNATFSGTLTSENARIEKSLSATDVSSERLSTIDASVSGRLVVKELIADKLSLSDNALDDLMEKLTEEMADTIASLINNGVDIEEITQIIDPLVEGNVQEIISPQPLDSATPSASDLFNTEIATGFADISSMSGGLPNLNNLISDRITVNQALMVFGVTSLAQVSVADLLSIGGSMTMQNNSINTLGAALEFQPLRQGNISLMAGRIIIDTEGNAVFNENLTVNKTLYAQDLRPVKNDLNVNLTDSQRFSVKKSGPQEAASFSVNSRGDVSASGSGSFLELVADNFKIVRGAQADTSSTETLASSSAGVGTIVPGQIERTIVSPFVNEDSLIYLTPASQTFGTTPYIARQTPQNLPQTRGSFTIRIQEETDQEIKINWWIIN